MTSLLIVTADDFGMHLAVNEAVEQASRSGVLSAASLMMGAVATADALRRARRLPHLRVGLHLVIADGFAALAPETIPGLADANGHLDDRLFINAIRFASSRSIRRQLEAEIRVHGRSVAQAVAGPHAPPRAGGGTQVERLHPGTRSGSSIAATMGGYRHAEELAALVSPRVREAVVMTKSRCGGYADIPTEWRGTVARMG